MIIVPSTSSNKAKQREDEEKKMKDRVKEFVFPRVLPFLFFSGISLCKNLSWCKSKKCKMLEIDNKVFSNAS